MRRSFFLLVFLLASAGCDTPSEPASFSIIGHWTSSAVDTLDIQMTISEAAREVNGAGSWVTPTQAMAFRVSGAHVEQSISLLFEFGDGPDVNFHGEFLETASDTLTMAGRLYGGSYRGSSIVFIRRIGSR